LTVTLTIAADGIDVPNYSFLRANDTSRLIKKNVVNAIEQACACIPCSSFLWLLVGYTV